METAKQDLLGKIRGFFGLERQVSIRHKILIQWSDRVRNELRTGDGIHT